MKKKDKGYCKLDARGTLGPDFNDSLYTSKSLRVKSSTFMALIQQLIKETCSEASAYSCPLIPQYNYHVTHCFTFPKLHPKTPDPS